MVVKKSSVVVAVSAVAIVFYLLGTFLGLPFVEGSLASGDINVTRSGDHFSGGNLNESVVKGKVPKKLRTYVPFWGVPQLASGENENYSILDDCYFFRQDEKTFPKWISWNLDLATEQSQRYHFDKFLPAGMNIPCRDVLCKAVDECYRWAWRKPYGNTNVVMGPLFDPEESTSEPYAYFVAVCKKENLKVPAPMGFSSLAYMIPVNAEQKNIYEYSLPVKAVEIHSGYELFPELPHSVCSMVKEMSAYDFLCSFQEVDQNVIDALQPEIEPSDYVDDPRRDL